MISLYDKALLQKLKEWTEDTNIHVYGGTSMVSLFSLMADENNDNPIELPIIVLKRIGGYEVKQLAKVPPTFNSYKLAYNENTVVNLNAIPVKVSYQIDIYARYFEEADLYCRDLIFNITNHPTANVIIPYNNVNFVHNFNMFLLPTVQDNSDVPESVVNGGFSRLTLAIDVDDAYLWSVPVHSTIKIDDRMELLPNGNRKEKECILIC